MIKFSTAQKFMEVTAEMLVEEVNSFGEAPSLDLIEEAARQIFISVCEECGITEVQEDE